MKFSSKCRTKKMEMILGKFCSFFNWKEPKSGLGKSLGRDLFGVWTMSFRFED